MQRTVFIPPDGGYGWIIVVATALNNFIAVPMSLNYGLVFQSTFSHLGLSATQSSVILNMNAAFGMLTGLINGPLLNNFGYRKISFLGATLMTAGLFLVSFARTWTGFILCYGFMTSVGVGLTMSSYSLAVNTYFKEKRDKAISISMTISGLGPVVMPQIINLLMEHYTSEGVTMILASICAHSFLAACLLQPVKYHQRKIFFQEMNEMKEIKKNEAEDKKTSGDFGADDEVFDDEVYHTVPAMTLKFPIMRTYSQADRGRYERKDSVKSLFYYDQEAAGVYGIDSTLVGSSRISLDTVRIPTLVRQNTKTKYQWWKSASTINLESCYNIFDEKPDDNKIYNELSVQIEKPTRWRRLLEETILLFDLDLLKDREYCVIMIGLSVAVFAEINFSALTVFILNDYGMDTGEIAEFLSVVAAADITFRFLAPYVDDVFKQPPRVVYIVCLVALVIVRSVMFLVKDVRYLYAVALTLGCIKGIRIVNMYLIIPNYVPLDRLASASGIQMVTNGLTILVWGPLIGVVEDLSGSYQACILVINFATTLTVILWTTHTLLNRCRKETVTENPSEQRDTLLG